jgi:hypothetical protein
VQGTLCTNPRSIATEFNKYFVDVPKKISCTLESIPFDLNLIKKVEKSIFIKPCTALEIETIITDLATKNSTGIDEISNRMFNVLGLLLLCLASGSRHFEGCGKAQQQYITVSNS